MSTMRNLAIVVVAAASALAGAQGHEIKSADALKDVAFLLGNWSGKQDFNTGGAPMVLNAKDQIGAAIGGRYIEERLTTTRQDGTTSDVRHFLTYLPKVGKFHAWWFNDTAAGPMEFEGSLENGKLVLTSTPTETSAGPGSVFRATYEKTSDNGLAYTLELKTGDSWRKLFRSEYTK